MSKIDTIDGEEREALFNRLDIPDQKLLYLGHGGFADVYWLPDRKRVLKITTDHADAQASQILVGKTPKHLVHTYDAFQITPKLYGIVNEKLTPLSSSQRHAWKVLTDIYFDDVSDLDIPMLSSTGLTMQWVMSFKDAVFSSPYAEKAEQLEDEFDTMLMFSMELDKHRIRWRDWTADNIMQRGHNQVISDLGGGTKSPATRIPTLH